MDQTYKNEIDLIDYIKIVYNRGWIVITLVAISMLYTAVTSLSQGKMYEATATFFPIKYQTSEASALVETQVGIENLIISILESRKMADRVIEQLDLKKRWGTDSMESLRSAIKGMTGTALEKNGIIKLSVRNKSAELAAEIANAHVDNLEYFNRELGLGARKQLVQVIDRAVVPENMMPGKTKKKVLTAGMASFLLAVFLVFLIDFVQKSELIKRLKGK